MARYCWRGIPAQLKAYDRGGRLRAVKLDD
jgi:hypothetical protein